MSPLIASSLINKAAFQLCPSLIVNIFAVFKQPRYRQRCRLRADLPHRGCSAPWEPQGFRLLPEDEMQLK